MKTLTFRLKPGSDLKNGIMKFVADNDIVAGFIITCVGGLQQATVRMASATPNSQDIETFKGAFEIVSLVETISVNGMHLHIAFSDTDGTVHGGHLKKGTIIHPTAEIVIGIDQAVGYTREMDNETGFKELAVKPKL